MSGYTQAHGDTHGVVMNLANDERTYRDVLGLCRATPSAARAVPMVREYVRTLQRSGTADSLGMTEVRDADLARVDWQEVVEDVCGEVMREQGHWSNEGGAA